MSKTRKLTHMSMFVVLQIVFTRFLGIQTLNNRISLTFIPMAIAGMMHGPVFSGTSAFVADLLGQLLFPKGGYPYFIGYGLTVFLSGFLYGLLKDKEKPFLWIVGITLVKHLFLHMILNTYWNHLLGGDSMAALLKVRYVKYMILIPFEIIVLPPILQLVKKQLRSMNYES